MDLTHRFPVPASVEEVWAAFNHLERLAPCFPGATITGTRGDDFEGSVKVKLGPTALVYSGSGRYLERDTQGHRVVFEASGTDGRGNGTAAVRVTATLSGRGSRTEVELLTDLALTGRPAQFGAGVVADVGHKLLDQFASCMAGHPDGVGVPGGADTGSGASPAADDELWKQWAGADERAAGEDSDTVTTLEMQTVGAEPPGTPVTPSSRSGSSSVAPSRTQALANVVSTVLARYGPLLGLLALVAVVVAQLVRRRRAAGRD